MTMPETVKLDHLDRTIINELQGGFPVCERPFCEISARFGIDEDLLMQRIEQLIDVGVISRFGPMYNVERLGGVYSLVAMKLPAHDLMRAANIINAYPEVAHNYEREHEFNLWFVVAAESEQHKQRVLREIEVSTGYPLHDMPKLEEFFVGLKFDA